jgi:DNA-binding Lrp family transcriptional regulator
MARRSKKEMEKLRERALSLIQANPTLSMTVVAEHVGVSPPTVSKWFDEEHLKRWS